MASKNHRRYATRKRINQIKHLPISRFSEPARLIHDWEELQEASLCNDRYKVKVDVEMGNGDILEKQPDGSWDFFAYLSTHSFYGKSQYFYATETLRKCGFNVQLENWDGPTIYSR